MGRKNLPINNFFIELSIALLKRDIKPILLVHGKANYVDKQLRDYDNITVLSWPSISPSLIRDVVFLTRLIIREKPNWIIANMRFQNIVLITSFILSVPNVISWVHTSFNNREQNSKRFDWLYRRLKGGLLKTSNKIIPVSKFLGEIVQQRYRLNKNNIYPINNVLKDSFENVMAYESVKKNTIICVGRLVSEKGHRILFYAFKECHSNKLEPYQYGD